MWCWSAKSLVKPKLNGVKTSFNSFSQLSRIMRLLHHRRRQHRQPHPEQRVTSNASNSEISNASKYQQQCQQQRQRQRPPWHHLHKILPNCFRVQFIHTSNASFLTLSRERSRASFDENLRFVEPSELYFANPGLLPKTYVSCHLPNFMNFLYRFCAFFFELLTCGQAPFLAVQRENTSQN